MAHSEKQQYEVDVLKSSQKECVNRLKAIPESVRLWRTKVSVKTTFKQPSIQLWDCTLRQKWWPSQKIGGHLCGLEDALSALPAKKIPVKDRSKKF